MTERIAYNEYAMLKYSNSLLYCTSQKLEGSDTLFDFACMIRQIPYFETRRKSHTS